ncbi:MAG: alpha/beta hydrolase [Thermoplasmata archaeon]|nr:alpha/beta hydrolase [Thermoplasmata archaeon]MCI4341519.1 alpha/beta hydrolase [Thermoplasmata archaeon]
MAAERDVRVGDGRRLRLTEGGAASGPAVFVLHGSPGMGDLYEPHVRDARARRVRLIGHDRSGYGDSTPHPGRSIADESADVAAIADELGIDRFGVWGFSGGGALALACAAQLPKRVVGAACISGLAPRGADGLDWLAGMGESNVEEFRQLLEDRPAWERKTTEECAALASADLAQLTSSMSTLLSEVDRAAFQGDLGRYFHGIMTGGVRHGSDGYRDDSLAQMQPWGFDVQSIRVPTQIWHGAQDRFVPYTHGQWLAARIAGAEAHLLPVEGHITLYEHAVPQVHAWLAARF